MGSGSTGRGGDQYRPRPRERQHGALAPDGGAEGLFAIDFTFGLNWTNLFLQYVGQKDIDALLAPIFDKTITASYTIDADTICLDGDVVFTNTSTFDTDYMYNRWDSLNMDPYTWNYDDGTGTYNHTDTTYTFNSVDTFNTQLLITNYGYTGNCVDSVQRTIVVNSPNVVASVDTAVCLGDTIRLSESGATTYTWDNGLGAGSSHDVVATIDTMYVVTGTDASGCSSTDTVNVTVNALPNLVSNGDTIICNLNVNSIRKPNGEIKYLVVKI